MVSVHPARWCISPLGVVPAGLGDGVGHCHDVAKLPREGLFISLVFLFGRICCTLFSRVFLWGFSKPLGMLVAKWVPTPCYTDAYSVGTPKWALWEKGSQKHYETTFSLHLGRFLFGKQKNFSGRVIRWMLHIGRARHPGPGPRDITPGQLSIEFINVGGWLTCRDLAMDSCAQFLVVAEHRFIPSRARSVCHHLRKAGHHSIWAPACQDKNCWWSCWCRCY